MKKKDLTLLVMAAGMGSRYGGLKQIEPVGPNGEFIIDYSIYDAKRVGFNKIIFVIKEENYDLFKETIGSRVEGKFDSIEYVFQKTTDLPEGFVCPPDRVKPWGTGHAILAAAKKIDTPFGVISADDFYGLDAYEKLAYSLNKMDNETSEYSLIGYQIKNTMSDNGTVKRGTCEAKDGYITNIVESIVERTDSGILAKPIDGRSEFLMKEDHLVSMLMFGFNPSVFKLTKELFTEFLNANKENLSTAEFIHADALGNSIGKGLCKIKLYQTDAKWYGVTYKEDKEIVINAINNYIEKGVYPEKLWNNENFITKKL